jgi:hypothetical protein
MTMGSAAKWTNQSGLIIRSGMGGQSLPEENCTKRHGQGGFQLRLEGELGTASTKLQTGNETTIWNL